MFSVFDVARYFLTKSKPGTEYAITHLKLQKIVYYAQAWHIALKNKPLFKERIEAWIHGPVCPELYDYYKEYGFEEIDPVSSKSVSINDKDTKEVLDFVWELYGNRSGKFLEQLTHQEDPWLNARGTLGEYIRSNNEISHESMYEYFSKFLKETV